MNKEELETLALTVRAHTYEIKSLIDIAKKTSELCCIAQDNIDILMENIDTIIQINLKRDAKDD